MDVARKLGNATGMTGTSEGDVTKMIESQKLTQAAAAKLLGVTQPRISDLVRGKIDRFSVDTLIEMLGHAGARVSVVVTPRSQVA